MKIEVITDRTIKISKVISDENSLIILFNSKIFLIKIFKRLCLNINQLNITMIRNES